MRGAKLHPIVIAAGGTGGHFFSAEALLAELSRRGHWVGLITDKRSLRFVPAGFDGRDRFVIRGAGLAGRSLLDAVGAGFQLAAGIVEARSILAKLDAAAVVAFGGYPAVAPVLAARLLWRRPAIILHEQNAVLGRANRFLSYAGDLLALSFPRTARVPKSARIAVVGNPVRPAICAHAARPYGEPFAGEFRVLVLGGSLGARVFSDVVPKALTALPEALRARLAVVQQCRPEDMARVRAAYGEVGIRSEIDTFFADVAEKMAAAHLVIARAGASTIAELGVIGRPALLVPLPNAIDDHQTANARAFAQTGGGWVMPQHEFTPEALRAWLVGIWQEPHSLAVAAKSAQGFGRAQAAMALADQVEALLSEESRV
jgi:UDP-N-acetylglucosamine--N-acetylmuramyl-(pentapeptide) pyrophosphoryl-undecaprenol N-acetylglucosamine transferase